MTKPECACVRLLVQIDFWSLLSVHVQKATSAVNKACLVLSPWREQQGKYFIKMHLKWSCQVDLRWNEVVWSLLRPSSGPFRRFDASSALFGCYQSIKAKLPADLRLHGSLRWSSNVPSSLRPDDGDPRQPTSDLWKRLSVPTDANLILQQEKLVARYPELLSSEAIPCDCGSMPCDSVYWVRTIPAMGQVQFLGRLNNANVFSHGKDVNAARFELKRKTKTSFLLRLINVTEEDTGVYSCVLKDRKGTHVWKSGILLLPGGL